MVNESKTGEKPDDKATVMQKITADNAKLTPKDKYQVGEKWDKARKAVEKRQEEEAEMDEYELDERGSW